MRLRLIGLAAASVFLIACGSGDKAEAPTGEPKSLEAKPAELVSQKLEAGAGEPATSGQTVTVHYTGWLFDPNAENNEGKKFDSSVDRGRPFSFPLGAGRVIRGWDQGVEGMQVGERRRLIIPPHLGYGARGAGNVIPGGSTLVFDVELLAVK
ncbi:MAG: FKBP-type peptidyl-prolyl cis-trans isomerase [Gammaproteobacteria bacterium]|nr:FKBP-type peptidyl-prolyl cis-trans isomerase [Gammaproteobacteria bacterium]